VSVSDNGHRDDSEPIAPLREEPTNPHLFRGYGPLAVAAEQVRVGRLLAQRRDGFAVVAVAVALAHEPLTK